MYPSIRNQTPSSNRTTNSSPSRSIVRSADKGSTTTGSKPRFTKRTGFTTGSGKRIEGSLTGRLISTTTAVTADSTTTPRTGTTAEERPSPKVLDNLFGAFSQDSEGYEVQDDTEIPFPNSKIKDDIEIIMSQEEEERYLKERKMEDDADAVSVK
jgi:hypothetical protein